MQPSNPAGGDVRSRVETLTAKALHGQWDPDAAIDWRGAPVPPRWLPRRAYADAVSQLYHAEVASQRIVKRLMGEVPDPAARRFLATQLADEERHAGVYARYLARLGDMAPPDEAIDTALHGVAAWDGPWQAIMAACHIVLEGEALHLQQACIDEVACPLLGRLTRTVMRDEARHVAFGRLFLKPAVAELGDDQRRDVGRRVAALWRSCAAVNAGRGRRSGVLLGWLRRGYLEERWPHHRAALAAVGLDGPAAAPAAGAAP